MGAQLLTMSNCSQGAGETARRQTSLNCPAPDCLEQGRAECLIRFGQCFVGVFAAVQLVVDFVVMLEVLRQQRADDHAGEAGQ